MRWAVEEGAVSQPRASPEAAAVHPQDLTRLAAAVGTHSLPGFCFSEQGENTFFPSLVWETGNRFLQRLSHIQTGQEKGGVWQH